MSPYSHDDALWGVGSRTHSGGLALPPRQLPPDAPRTVALDAPPYAVRILVGVADMLEDAVASIRRAAADRGIS